MTRWTAADIPPQAGKVVIVTGATSGIGFETARELARTGAKVIIAARNPVKAAATIAAIRQETPRADLQFEEIDVGILASVRTFAHRIASTHRAIDVLVNNAGLMMLPFRLVTADGLERQFGTNHLGAFALTAELWPLLAAAPAARVVAVASNAHRRGRMNFDDLNGERRYDPYGGYAQSKLANLLFALELQRRIPAGARVISVAAHPGLTSTALYRTGRETGAGDPDHPAMGTRIRDAFFRSFGQKAAIGALPLLFAATAPGVRGGGYYGPGGIGEFRGYPAPSRIGRQVSEADARRLWLASEEMTGTRFNPAAMA